jgi:beta-glucuronidase
MDFRSPARMLPEMQDHPNRKGVISNPGQPKLTFHLVEDFYRKQMEAGK